MKDRFNLEEEISQLHNFADQLGTLSEGILEHNLSQDEVSNGLEGLKVCSQSMLISCMIP